MCVCALIDQVSVALGSCCCYHCSEEGGEEGVWFTALRASGQCVCVCVCDLMGLTVCTVYFQFQLFLLALIFAISTTICTIKLAIITAYLVRQLDTVTVQQEKGSERIH